eukprot:4222736-Amphidinium_carterae.1
MSVPYCVSKKWNCTQTSCVSLIGHYAQQKPIVADEIDTIDKFVLVGSVPVGGNASANLHRVCALNAQLSALAQRLAFSMFPPPLCARTWFSIETPPISQHSLLGEWALHGACATYASCGSTNLR